MKDKLRDIETIGATKSVEVLWKGMCMSISALMTQGILSSEMQYVAGEQEPHRESDNLREVAEEKTCEVHPSDKYSLTLTSKVPIIQSARAAMLLLLMLLIIRHHRLYLPSSSSFL
ncbi:unnamed protein product [Acanthocheilonema viteae]|uniref:Uncharacterized protein n=1 Tax=Acanthocheilonema viteae TaxID=6277 RepID=A0A498S6F0_ACAVI|nr:unnamed protein product [Acanthocheilonema viteae]